MAWNVVTTSSTTAAANFGIVDHLDRDTRHDWADEVLDKVTGQFADPSTVHHANYADERVQTRGPLTVPRSPQGRPVIMQAGSSPRGREFAARWAEIIFTLQHAKPDMQAFRTDMAGRMGNYGRAPTDCAILTSVDPIIGGTRSSRGKSRIGLALPWQNLRVASLLGLN